MEYPNTNLFLKDGREVTFAKAAEKDALEVMHFFQNITQETEFLSKSSAETMKSVNEVKYWLMTLDKSKKNLFLIAKEGGNILGMGQLIFSLRHKSKHRATVAVAVRKPYWNLGLGTQILTKMASFARYNGVSQLELTVMENNQNAIKLYQKLGFIQVGKIPNAFLMQNGSYSAELIFVKQI